MNMDLVKELGDYLRDIAPNAIIRYGDYPRGIISLRITLILSQLKRVDQVKEYYEKMADLTKETVKRQRVIEAELKELIDASKAVPSLL
jgi:hypothetical protein